MNKHYTGKTLLLLLQFTITTLCLFVFITFFIKIIERQFSHQATICASCHIYRLSNILFTRPFPNVLYSLVILYKSIVTSEVIFNQWCNLQVMVISRKNIFEFCYLFNILMEISISPRTCKLY